MSKRSYEASLSPASSEYQLPTDKDERDALEGDTPPTKYSLTDAHEGVSHRAGAMQCTLAPHTETTYFDTQEEYEVHYTKEHTNRCATCSKNFPSPRFLELHIEENHNALREALAARGEKTYGCFVEDCDRKCSTPQKRRLHMIDKHMYPRTYNFRIVDHGIDKASSMLREGRRRRVSTVNDNRQAGRHRRQASSQLQGQSASIRDEKTNQIHTGDASESSTANLQSRKADGSTQSANSQGTSKDHPNDMDTLTQSLSALRFVPTSVLRKRNREAVYPDNGDSHSTNTA